MAYFPGGGGGNFTLISEQILAAAANSVTFSAIPQTYRNLQLFMSVKTADTAGGNDDVAIQFNGDTAANYAHQRTWTTSNSYTGSTGNGETGAVMASVMTSYTGTGVPANYFSEVQAYIGSYTATDRIKAVRAQCDFVTTMASGIYLLDGVAFWLNAAAINAMKIYTTGGSNFVAGSKFQLYGIT
ncbi:MAG: hypothetical protein LC754_10380 [Acidobacteria bacterium]|nr:hypothetical protein [Acidobacteriota bacterium]